MPGTPREAIASSLYAIGMAFFFKGQFTEAASKLLLLLQYHPGASEAYRVLAACYAHMGRLEEARMLVTRLRSISPELLPKTVHWRKAEHRDLFFSGLRLAMGETE
jgi:tetratricopeptide (TPR) repeat protein